MVMLLWKFYLFDYMQPWNNYYFAYTMLLSAAAAAAAAAAANDDDNDDDDEKCSMSIFIINIISRKRLPRFWIIPDNKMGF